MDTKKECPIKNCCYVEDWHLTRKSDKKNSFPVTLVKRRSEYSASDFLFNKLKVHSGYGMGLHLKPSVGQQHQQISKTWPNESNSSLLAGMAKR